MQKIRNAPQKKPLKSHLSNNLSMFPDIPAGHLLRCGGCSYIHFCDMSNSAAGGGGDERRGAKQGPSGAGRDGREGDGRREAAGQESDSEELREGSEEEDEDERVPSETGGASSQNEGDQKKMDKIDISKRFRPRGEDHNWCVQYVKTLKKKICELRKSKDVFRAKYADAKDELTRTHQELDRWDKEKGDSFSEEETRRRVTELLEKHETVVQRLDRAEAAQVCRDPEHQQDFCNVPHHKDAEAIKCNVPEHKQGCPFGEDEDHCNSEAHRDWEEKIRGDYCNIPAHRMACLMQLTQPHCTRPEHDGMVDRNRELQDGLASAQEEIEMLKKQKERCKKNVDELFADGERNAAEISTLRAKYNKLRATEDVLRNEIAAVELLNADVEDQLKVNKGLVEAKAVEIQNMKFTIHAVTKERDSFDEQRQKATNAASSWAD